MRRSDPVEVEAERLRSRLSNDGVQVDVEIIVSVLRAQRGERRERSMRGKERALQDRSAAPEVSMPPSSNPRREPSPSSVEEERVIALLGNKLSDSDVARIGGVSRGLVTMVKRRYPQQIAERISQFDAAQRETGEGAS